MLLRLCPRLSLQTACISRPGAFEIRCVPHYLPVIAKLPFSLHGFPWLGHRSYASEAVVFSESPVGENQQLGNPESRTSPDDVLEKDSQARISIDTRNKFFGGSHTLYVAS